MTVENKLLVHLEHIVMPEGVPLNAAQITVLCPEATEEQRWQAVLRSRRHGPLILPDERPAANNWALEARRTGDSVLSVPVRGKTSLSRDLWWCGNCGRGVGGDNEYSQDGDYLAGSWAFCPTCGKKLDWDAALGDRMKPATPLSAETPVRRKTEEP